MRLNGKLTLSNLPLERRRTQLFSSRQSRACVEIESTPVAERIFRFTLRILNLENTADAGSYMLSTHTLLAVQQGAFRLAARSSGEYRAAAAACHNIATWPVLAGREGDRHLMLSSPIILYDYPQIAPESAGDFFDGTEIDEILTLRVLTLSDEEKREVREGSDRARSILERTESLPPERPRKCTAPSAACEMPLNSSIAKATGSACGRAKRPTSLILPSMEKSPLSNRWSAISKISIHLAVTVEDDPGRDLGVAPPDRPSLLLRPEDVELV